jgi:PAP2 superfamily
VTADTATSLAPADQATRALPFTRRIRHGWIIELTAGVVVFLVYDWIRDHVAGTTAAAFRNAKQIVAAQEFLGLYHERTIQEAFLSVDWFIAFWNIFYGTIHFVMPVVALVVLYVKAPARYRRWRNVMVFMLGFGLIGFWLYPLMPPRLMPPRYGFVDTAAEYFNFGPQVRVTLDADGQPSAAAVRTYGNLFAAMPSLHVAWSTWCVFALWPLVRRRILRVLLLLYPLAMLFCIVVTANHWILDAAGGWAVLALAYGAAVCAEWVVRRTTTARARTRRPGGTVPSA